MHAGVAVLLRKNCASSFIHHDDFTFIRGAVTEGRISTACVSVESWWNDRLRPRKLVPYMADSIHILWESAQELVTSASARSEMQVSFLHFKQF